MRFHVVGLPHTETTTQYLACAFTQKVVKFCKMMKARGHTVFLYSGEENEAECSVHVPVVTKAKQKQWFGNTKYCVDPSALPNIDYNSTLPHWQEMNSLATAAIYQKAHKNDILCLISNSQRQIANAIPDMLAVEYGVGYEGTHTHNRAFESHSWRHHVYGLRGERDGNPTDVVIPNYFDPDEFFGTSNPLPPKGDYYLWMGRMVRRKGPRTAVLTTEHLQENLVLAGQGCKSQHTHENITCLMADEISLVGKHIKHVGMVGVEERARLMAGAKAFFMPTGYIEPFGGVHIEAMLCGTPVITSNWGVFPETVIPGVNGFLCDTFDEYVQAARTAPSLDPNTVRKTALKYTLAEVAPMFERWFDRLLTARK